MRFKKSLAMREQILAYKLLIPAFTVLLCLALYPLGQVFYTSLTDKKFASDEKTHFVGVNNYWKLLAFSFKIVSLDNNDFKEIDKSVESQLKSKESFAALIGQKWSDAKRADETESLAKAKADFTVQQKAEASWQKSADEYKQKSGKSQVAEYKVWETFRFGDSFLVIGAGSPDFFDSIINTLIFTVFAVGFATLLGLIIALVVNSKFIGRGAMRGVMLVPWAIITIVSAKIWQWMLVPNRTGLLNTVMSYLNLGDGQTSFLTSNSLALPAMIAIDVWKTTPFMALLLLAGLQVIPSTLYEAARVDGASRIRQFFSITLPLLKPTIAVALIFRTLDSLRVFDLFQVLLGDRLYSMASYNYAMLIKFREMGMASAVGVIIFIIIYGFAFGYMKLLGVNNEE